MDLPEPQRSADERTTLTEMLNYQRTVFLRKLSGISKQQALTRLEPSNLTLAGLMRHLDLVDIYWFSVVLQGKPMPPKWADADWDADPDWEMTSAADFTLDEITSDYVETWNQVNSISTEMDLNHAGVTKNGVSVSHRWVLVHLIEEYARHNGHADLIRESIDGTTGD